MVERPDRGAEDATSLLEPATRKRLRRVADAPDAAKAPRTTRHWRPTAEDLKERRRFLDRSLLYLFSYDVETKPISDEIGFVPGGLRLDVECIPNQSRVYHLMRERSVAALGTPGVSGIVTAGGDAAFLREDDVVVSTVQMTICTDDGVLIDSRYQGKFSVGAGGYRRAIGNDKPVGTEKNPLVVSVVVTPRYETASAKYRWLTEYQCVGFGAITIIKNHQRSVSYDIYAML
jgi:hypothetical protein